MESGQSALRRGRASLPQHVYHLTFTLDQLVRRLKSASATQVNRQRGVAGALWQRGYYDHLVRDDENLQNVARYIVANSLRAGLVKRLGDYPFWNAVWLDEGRG